MTSLKSIRGRLVGSCLLIILVVTVIFGAFLMFVLRQYYYNDIGSILENRAWTAANTYSLIYNTNSLDQNADEFLKSIIVSSSENVQVQIIDTDGAIIADSENSVSVGTKLNDPDVINVLKGQQSTKWIAKTQLSHEPAIFVSHHLTVDNNVVGVVRLISSLSGVNAVMVKIMHVLAGVGTVILLIVLLLSYLLSTTIIKPVKEITVAAEQIAQGKLDVRVPKRYDDEVGKLAVTLNHMAEELSKHKKLTEDFISSTSHELRTPLTSIKGWASTLNTGNFTDMTEVKEGLKIIENETDRLALLVNDLLDFSKLTSKKTSLGLEAVDVGEFLCEIRNQMNPRAQRKGIFLGIDIEDDLALIKADRNRLKQVMINILDNSLKYSQEGGRIMISCRSKDNGILISVEDSGIGIPEEDLPRVKEKFYKVSTSFSGNGLGLAICDEIINLHNGKLDISSVLGEGTKVDIYLPLPAS